MCKLVGNDASQLIIVENAQEACCNGDGIRVAVNTRGEGIQLWVVDDVQFGHIHSARHCQILHDIIHSWILFACEGACSCCCPHHGGVCLIGNYEPYGHSANDPWYCAHERPCYACKVYTCRGVAVYVGFSCACNETYHGKENPYHKENNDGEHEQQEDAHAIIAPLLGI